MVDTINHPYCDVTPDFCNWEHEYMLFNGLKALAPYSTRRFLRAAALAYRRRDRVSTFVNLITGSYPAEQPRS